MRNLFIFCGILFSFSSCTDSSSSGSSIGAPSLRPPVESATPTSLKGSSTSSIFKKLGLIIQKAHADGTVEVNTLQSEIFSSTGSGPLHIMNILGQVDGRMDSLNSRALEFDRLCLTQTAQAFTFPTNFEFVHNPSYSFDMFFQCHEQISNELDMAFGIYNEKLYLMEAQSSLSGFNGVILAQADLNSNLIEIWILSSNTSGHSSFLYISSEENSGIKFSIGGHTQNNGTTCGMKLAASESVNRVHLNGIFADSLNAGDCTGTNPVTTDLCIRSTDLSQNETDCDVLEPASITNLPDLNYTTIFNTSPPSGVSSLSEFNTYAQNSIESLISDSDFSNLTDFNESVPDE